MEANINKKTQKKFYQTNQYIKAETLRVVDSQARQLGVLTKDEALRMAEEQGLDLVLVGPNAKPPVAKLISFSNFKYREQKKEQSSKKSTKNSEIKEIRLTPFIAQNDLNTRVIKAKEFLQDGDKVKINVKFTGRQVTKKEFGADILAKLVTQLSEWSVVDQEPRMQGMIMSMMLKPKKQ